MSTRCHICVYHRQFVVWRIADEQQLVAAASPSDDHVIGFRSMIGSSRFYQAQNTNRSNRPVSFDVLSVTARLYSENLRKLT
jgi:hypothetical protein